MTWIMAVLLGWNGVEVAFKHFMISAKAGYPVALEFVTDNYKNGVKRGYMTQKKSMQIPCGHTRAGRR